MALNRKLRYGMIGGGPGAFIGGVHRKAVRLEGHAELVAGAFSSDPDKSREQGQALHLSDDRVYESYEQMAEEESARPEGDRIDFVSIVTPNHLHYDVARTFLEAGFHVVCDKPMTRTVEEAESLCELVSESGLVFALTHNYSGYPMVRQARKFVADGELGEIRKIMVEYTQGWLASKIEEEGAKQAEWRTDPDRAGISSAIGDIGTHAEHLARFVTGLELESLCADLTTFVPGRRLEDDANMLLRYEGGARGMLSASQISVGEENALTLRVYGTKGALRWRQENPNYLHVLRPDGPEEVYKRGNDYLADVAIRSTRLPSGHPEGFFGAFANIYAAAIDAISAHISGDSSDIPDDAFPTVFDGAKGVHFIHTAVESGREESWLDARYSPPVAQV